MCVCHEKVNMYQILLTSINYQLLSTPNQQTLVDYLGFPTPAGPLSPDPSFAAGAPTSPCDPTSLGRLGPESLELFFAGQQVADSSLEFLVCYILYVLAKHWCCCVPSVVCLLFYCFKLRISS